MARTQHMSPPGRDRLGRMDIDDDIVYLRQAQRFDMHNPRLPTHNGAMMHNSSRQHNERFKDVVEWQFWPKSISMGTMAGKTFVQMLGANVQYGEDTSNTRIRGVGKSYLSFDWTNETIMMKAAMSINPTALPPALRPLDAELAFDDVASQGIMIDETKTGPGSYQVTVTISTRRPPKYFIPFEGQGFGREMLRMHRRRATAMDFAISGTSERDAGPIPAIPAGPCAFPTFWRCYRFFFELNGAEYNKLRQAADAFKALARDEPEMDLFGGRMPRLGLNVLDDASYQRLYGVPDMSQIPFATRALIEGLIAHGILQPGQVVELWKALQYHAHVPAFQHRLLESLYQEERVRSPERLIAAKAAYLRRARSVEQPHLVMVRTVLVTPTRLVISPPQQEPSNSVTRRYAKKIDAVIRVQFADEEDKLFVLDGTREADKVRKDVGVMARVRRALQHGIQLGGRTFMPVASSASQQKDHAIWYIDTSSIDGLELRRWMGSVDETIVAKHSARMCLPFSTSRIVELNIKLGPRLKDVEKGQYCFTDGVGVGGVEVMREAAKALGYTKGLNSTPSAIQFRLGGAKGVLACWPHLASEHEVRMRKSLVKFESQLTDLNVVRLAKYQPAFLNRQFILIMCANGVPEQLIIEIFNMAVNSIKGLRKRVQSAKMTKDDHRLITTCSGFPLAALIKAGFHRDPTILDIAEIIECRALQDLKWRARVKLQDGVYLIGIADELGVLGENEVFCQYQESDETAPVVVQSECLICRAPALHPGDVRRCFAVDRPELRHLKNVIVFNIKGARDLPNMLGGGDLDGDDYTLIWDQRFVKPLRNHPPMDYTAPPPIRVDRVTQTHLNENFVSYILNDVLGQVDFWHMAWSDFHSPFHADCMELSQIHSTAVDFAKTGIPADLNPRLRPKVWPSYMDRDGNKKVYESQKVLGKLFRVVQPDPTFRPSDIVALKYPTDPRITRFAVFRSVIDRLKPVKARYESDLQYDLRRYRVFEPEVPTGIALKNKRRRRARDQNLNEPLQDSYESHVRTAREAAKEAIEGLSFSGTLDGMQVAARHAYALTYEREHVEEWASQLKEGLWGGRVQEDNDAMEDFREVMQTRPMTSFAWVFAQELIEIANIPNHRT